MDDAAIWTSFWQYDRVASCLDGDDHANYAAEVAGGWAAFFAALPARATVIDLCTGNGAIALLAMQAARDFTVIGVDRAPIDPRRHVTKFADALARIEFRGNVAAEALPLPDAAVDAVTSQYGVEYTDTDRTLAEVRRVLRPGGRCRFVIHAAEGEVRAGSLRVVADADRLLVLPMLVRDALERVVAVEQALIPDPAALAEAKRAFARFTTALGELSTYPARDTLMRDNVVGVIRDLWDRRRDVALARLLAKADTIATEIRAHRGRSAALAAAARDAAGVAVLAERLATLGLIEVTAERLVVGGHLVGHVLSGRAP